MYAGLDFQQKTLKWLTVQIYKNIKIHRTWQEYKFQIIDKFENELGQLNYPQPPSKSHPALYI